MASSSSMDWDKFLEESTEIERTCREISARMEQQNAESRRSRMSAAARDVVRGQTQPSTDSAPIGRPILVRERPPGDDHMSLEERLKEFQAETRAALAEIRYDVLALRNDLSGIRKEMATKAEVESVRDDIRVLAEGYSQTQQRLHETSGLLRRFLTDTHSA
jgi:hypothetical protein